MFPESKITEIFLRRRLPFDVNFVDDGQLSIFNLISNSR